MPFVVTTPLAAEQRCETASEVSNLIREYMEGKKSASLDNVTVIEVPPLQGVENGVLRASIGVPTDA